MNEKSITLKASTNHSSQWFREQREEMVRRIKQEIPEEGNVFVFPIRKAYKQLNQTQVLLEVSIRWYDGEEEQYVAEDYEVEEGQVIRDSCDCSGRCN